MTEEQGDPQMDVVVRYGETSVKAYAYTDGPAIDILGEMEDMTWAEWDALVAWMAQARALLAKDETGQ
jgi:hypothetical protein